MHDIFLIIGVMWSYFKHIFNFSQIVTCFTIFTAKRGQIHVFLKTLTGRTLGIPGFSSWNTILDLKRAIQDKEGFLSHEVMLIYNGEKLENQNATFADCHIEKDPVIHLVPLNFMKQGKLFLELHFYQLSSHFLLPLALSFVIHPGVSTIPAPVGSKPVI